MITSVRVRRRWKRNASCPVMPVTQGASGLWLTWGLWAWPVLRREGLGHRGASESSSPSVLSCCQLFPVLRSFLVIARCPLESMPGLHRDCSPSSFAGSFPVHTVTFCSSARPSCLSRKQVSQTEEADSEARSTVTTQGR